MSAGVHYALMAGNEWLSRLLINGQGVDIRTQGDGGAGMMPDLRDYAGFQRQRQNTDARSAQPFGDFFCGPVFII